MDFLKRLAPAAALATLLALPAAFAVPPQGKVVGPDGQCVDCGTVRSVDVVQRKGDSSGKGAVIGAVIGGVVGHQFGSGRGNDAMTAGGAVAGAVAGNEVEKNRKSGTAWRISVDMDGGGTRAVDVPDPKGLAVGTRVRFTGNNLQAIN